MQTSYLRQLIPQGINLSNQSHTLSEIHRSFITKIEVIKIFVSGLDYSKLLPIPLFVLSFT